MVKGPIMTNEIAQVMNGQNGGFKKGANKNRPILKEPNLQIWVIGPSLSYANPRAKCLSHSAEVGTANRIFIDKAKPKLHGGSFMKGGGPKIGNSKY